MTDETLSQETAKEHNTNATSISERKREANRKNAQRSTGPKTEAGKNHSRRNALKHGFLTKVLPLADFERSAEIREFSEELIKNAQPEGPLERLQVDLIVQAYWKLRRLQVAENASIEIEIRHAEELWRYEPHAYKGALEWRNSFSEVRKSIELHGYADAAIAEGLQGLTIEGGLKSEFIQANEKARALAEEKSNDASGVREKEFRKAQSDLSRVLEELWDRAREMDYVFEKIDARRRLPHLLQRLVPDTSETILRYQTATQNQLYRAIAELEHLQRQRRGGVVSPPLRLTI